MPAPVCPECGSFVVVRGILTLGHLVHCPECRMLLRVIALQPLELHWADERDMPQEERDEDNSYN